MAKIRSERSLERWFKAKPHRVRSAVTSRVVLRILPLLAVGVGPRGGGASRLRRDVVLPVFRAAALCWVAASWPRMLRELRKSDTFSTASSAIVNITTITNVGMSAFQAAYAALLTLEGINGRLERDSIQHFASAMTFATTAVPESRQLNDLWNSVSLDVSAIESGAAIIRHPLWLDETPDWWLQYWDRLKQLLIDEHRDWRVWTDWYEARCFGETPNAELEFARVSFDEAVWKQGPRKVNRHIKKLIETFKDEEEASPGGIESSSDTATIEISENPPPKVPLPDPSPATHFAYTVGKFDTVPPVAWRNREIQAATYQARARELAANLAERLSNTDAMPDVASSVSALLDMMGDDVTLLQPDQLRLASRSISAKARAFGHPAAEFEISPESVGALFELSDVLIDLQSIVRSDLDAHEKAIRQLDLTPESAVEAKSALDVITDGILSSGVISERVEVAFAAAAKVSDAADDAQVKIAIEGDRALLAENLALAVARELGRGEVVAPSTEEHQQHEDRTVKSSADPTGKETSTHRRKRKLSELRSWDDFGDRILDRIHKKGPDKIADATIDAAASAIKHAPKTVLGLGGAFLLWSAAYPILATGAVATTIAWIGYEVIRHNKKKD